MEDRSSAAITATIAIINEDYANNKTLLEMETLVNSTPIIISSLATTITPNNAQSFNYLSLIRILVLMIGFGVLIICMIFGNLLVIVSIVMERDLRRTQYYLILSLAVADLLVGLLVSPFAAVYDIQEEWNLGVMMCEFWTSMDVLACTSSILHLVAIALDRYWSITDISYMQKRTVQRIFVMVAIIWSSSLIISIGPIFGWKDDAYEKRIQEKQCLISQDILYQICGTMAAFYAPLAFIMILYWKIYSTARQRIKAQRQRRVANARGLVNQHKTHAYKAIGAEDKRATVERDKAAAPVLHRMSNAKKPYLSVESASSSHELDSTNDSILALNDCGKNSSTSPLVEVTATAVNDGAAAVATPAVNGGGSGTIVASTLDTGALVIKNETTALQTRPPRPARIRSVSFFVRAGRSLRLTMKSNTENLSIKREKRKPPKRSSFDERRNAEYSAEMSNNKSPSLNATSSQSSSRSLHRKSSTTHTSKNNGHCKFSSDGSGVSSGVSPFASPTNKSEPLAKTSGGAEPSTPSVTTPPSPTSPSDTAPAAGVQLPTSSPETLKSQLSTTTTTTKLKTPAAVVADKAVGKRNGGAADGGRSSGLTKRQIAEAKRERRAGRTLAIITGIFVVCWLPFFLLALYRPLCVYFYCSKDGGHNDQGNQAVGETGRADDRSLDVDGGCCSIPPMIQSAMAWLGYLNSALNPILYTIFSPDFRHAFKKLLTRFLRC